MPLRTMSLAVPSNPQDISTYPAIYQKAINTIAQQVDELQQREIRHLTSLGIVPPIRSKNIFFNIKALGDVLIHVFMNFPEYTYPPHLLFRIPLFRPDTFAYYYLAYPQINPTDNRFTKAYDDYRRGGLANLVRLHPGIWLNRPPYLLFNDFGRHSHNEAQVPYHAYITTETDKRSALVHTYKVTEPLYSPVNDPAWQKPALQLVQSVNPGTIQMICDRLHFYASLGDDLTPGYCSYTPLSYLEPDNKAAYQEVPHSVIWGTFLPPSYCHPESVTLKIIPTQDSRAGALPQFFADLAAAKSPLVFELVCETGAIYYLLTCASEDRPLVEDQFHVHFPEFEIVEHTERPITPLPVFTVHTVPESHYEQINSYKIFPNIPTVSSTTFFLICLNRDLPRSASFLALLIQAP